MRRDLHLLLSQVGLQGVDDRGGQRRYGEVHAKKTWKRWVLAGMEPTGSQVTVRDRDLSSPDAPRGTGRPKSK